MANMSYCRNENTARDLQDVVDNWEPAEELSPHERQGRREIIRLAREIVEMEGAD